MIHRQLLIIVVTLLSVSLLSCANPLIINKPITVSIVHTNDTHSNLETLTISNEPDQGGVARRKTLINQIRQERGAENVLFLDAGDYSQGTVFYNAWEGSENIMVINNIGYDAVTFGNHEFDLGVAKLVRALRGEPIKIGNKEYPTEAMKIPMVVTNLDASAEPTLNQLIQPSLIITKGGQRYGILGVITETASTISNAGTKVKFLDYLSSVQAEANQLVANGVNKIILLSHYGYDIDVQNAPKLSHIDVIISGHDHALLADKAAVQALNLPTQVERIKGNYPTAVRDQDGNLTLIVSAMEWGRWLGRLDVNFDAEGHIVDNGWQGKPLFVQGCTLKQAASDCSQAISEDPELQALVMKYRQPMNEFINIIIGKAGMSFDQNKVREQETELGNLVADVMLAATKTSDKAVVALTNGGTIRAPLQAGEITFGNALKVLPFNNTIVVIQLSGQQLVSALDNGLSQAGGKASGAFPQVAGMQVRYCAKLPCSNALLPNGVVTALNIQGVAVNLNNSYLVATNNYLAGGGDFYTVFKQACQTATYCRDTGVVILDAVKEEFAQHSPITRQIEGRITSEIGLTR